MLIVRCLPSGSCQHGSGYGQAHFKCLHCLLAPFPAAEMDVQAAVGLTAALTAIIISRQASGSLGLFRGALM